MQRRAFNFTFALALVVTSNAAQGATSASSSSVVASEGYAAPASRWRSDLYSQSDFDGRSENLLSHNRLSLNYKLAGGFSLFAGGELRADTKTTRSLIYNDNYATPVAGLAWTSDRLGLVARLESLYAYRDLERSNRSAEWEAEGRAVVFHYFFAQPVSAFSRNRRLAPFFETYTEGIYRTSLADNAFGQHWSKAGLRLRLGSGFSFDVYPEAAGHKDVKGEVYANRAELRAGGRLAFWRQAFDQGSQTTLSAAISATVATPLYEGPSWLHSPLQAALVISAQR